ncbi:hypothetical protein [Methylobacter tundripaludum]|uniref:hypothetical protein n=1 Tax=Methylobacter tundripaludum TaxID=173365 RepID=UPI0004DFA8D9|nr:hypothetical protein [Methylobacter tundripaludum]
MNSSSDEIGVITVFVEQLQEQSIPQALAMKKRIEDGESLNEIEEMHLEEQLNDAISMIPLLKHHPEYQKLTTELASLYNEISGLALKNEVDNRK